MNTILTIGHSNHSLERFVGLLAGAGANAVADVRSRPASRFCPHFNKGALSRGLGERRVAYVFLGDELGGRPSNPDLFADGVADYEKMAEQPEFRAGLDRLLAGAERYRIAVMCAEADPLDCHRCLLISRALAERGAAIEHILASGDVVAHRDIEDRIIDLAGAATTRLLNGSRAERLADAYRSRARKVAFASGNRA